MQTNLEKTQERKFLLFSLAAIGFVIVLVNFFGEDTTIIVANWMYVPVTGTLVVLSIIIAARHRFSGNHGKAWFLFACMTVSWFIAEQLWMVYELVYEIDTYPSEADYFWIAGYPLYFGFLIFYLRPIKNAISKKLVISAVIASSALLVPSLYAGYDAESEISNLEFVFGLTYPILDAIVLVPALIGVVLFLKGEVNFLWTLMCLAIFCDVIADTGFLFTTLDESYYSGHPIEILFLWSYVLFSFGVYHHIKLFKSRKESIGKMS